MKIVIATKNQGKLREFKTLLADLPLTVTSLSDYPAIGEIAETGSSFADNAALKAEAVARQTGLLTLADDSGLEVDALGGRPGIYSARFADPAADREYRAVLAELRHVPLPERTARFRSVIALARPGEKTIFVEGICEGLIAERPAGSGGFGYDPLFFVPAVGQTFAEMPPAVKNKISHRARAMAAARVILQELLQAEK